MTTAADSARAAAVRDYSAFDAELTHQALNLRLFARLLGWMKPYRITLFASLVLVVGAAAMSVLLPVIQGRVVVDTILVPNASAADMPDYGLVGATQSLAGTLGVEPLTAAVVLFVALVLAQAVLMFAHRLTLASSALKALRDLRLELFAALEHKPASFYDRVAVGRVMTRVTNDVENLFELLLGFGMLAGEFVPFVLALFLMFHISTEVTGVLLLVIPAAAAATYAFRLAMREIFRLVRDSVSGLNQYMQEDLMGIEVVQLSGREAANAREYRRRNQENRRQEFRAIDHEVVFETFNTSLASVATAVVVWYAGGEVVQEAMSLGSMILFNQYINMMINPVVAVGQQFNTLFRSMASGERIFQALDWDERIHEPERPAPLPDRLRGEIEFRHVHFAYPGGADILKDVSFRIAPGEKLAIVGPTGSGKSTVIRLLARFYDFDDGMIFLDGLDVNAIATRLLRQRIGVVLQDFHVFSGTVLENIALNDPAITPERAQWAARAVNADPFIRRLPDGYDTVLAERGNNLSQGQQQLLAFARVLAADPEILVLDEATSSIDTGSELAIQDALHRITEGRTSIVIAHRLQTIQECDRVLVLHRGTVQEHGTHDELIAQRGIYYTLHELQFQDSAVAAELQGGEDASVPEPSARWQGPPDDEGGAPGFGPGGEREGAL